MPVLPAPPDRHADEVGRGGSGGHGQVNEHTLADWGWRNVVVQRRVEIEPPPQEMAETTESRSTTNQNPWTTYHFPAFSARS